MAKNVLVVDDSEQNRKRLGGLLYSRGFDVVEAEDGMVALRKLGEGQFDLIFSDVSMPNMNGFEFLSKVKRDSRYSGIPVIMFTAEDKPEDVARGKRLGCAYYMIKPFNSEKMDAAMRAAGIMAGR